MDAMPNSEAVTDSSASTTDTIDAGIDSTLNIDDSSTGDGFVINLCFLARIGFSGTLAFSIAVDPLSIDVCRKMKKRGVISIRFENGRKKAEQSKIT